MSKRIVVIWACVLAALGLAAQTRSELAATAPQELRVGFAAVDVTPKIRSDQPVYLAGFGNNRQATGVHDPIMARTVVLAHGDRRIALVSVDLIGFFLPDVERVRQRVEGFDYVLVSSTHNHEGPDTLGLWGPTAPLPKSGVDPAYVKRVEDGIVASIAAASGKLEPSSARIGKAALPELLHDGRLPIVKHDELVVLDFQSPGGQRQGLVVQWNCHPETLSSKNTLVSADFVGFTVNSLGDKCACPVVYFTGTVGGLMTSLDVPIKDDDGKELQDGTLEKTRLFGRKVAEGATRALASAVPLNLTPLAVQSKPVFIPMENKNYHAARWMGILQRECYFWKGDPNHAEPAPLAARDQPLCIKTEAAILHLGDLGVIAFPGEVYPELVLGKIQIPVDPGADYPDAPPEPALYDQLRQRHRMIIGLANDEIGYVLPKSQWDEKPPFCYGRSKPQYGEQNSVGPDAAPLLCEAFRQLARQRKP